MAFPRFSLMRADERKSVRRRLGELARIDIGDGREHRCLLWDISASGARMTLETSNDLPTEFTLLPPREVGAPRQCRVIWRRREDIGVEFLPDRKAPIKRD